MSAIEQENESMTEKTYRIFHNYDRGDQSEYLASSIDPTRAAIYCQLLVVAAQTFPREIQINVDR